MTARRLPSLLLLLALASAALPTALAGRKIKPASTLQESPAEGQGSWVNSQLFGHQPVQTQSASADATATASGGLSQAAASATASSQSGGLAEAIARATTTASTTGTTTGTADADASSQTGSWLDRLGGGFWSRSNGNPANQDRGSSSSGSSSSGYGSAMGGMGGSSFGSAAGGGSMGSAGASSSSAGTGAANGNSTGTGVCKDALARHNEYRARHNAAPLTWSATIAASAQAWSDRCVFEHSHGQYGENLAMGYSTCAQAVDAWYAERSSYSGSFSMSAGHFTQVVWKGSKELGCGYNAGCKMVTCQYSPAGNVMGAFAANVDP